MDGVTSFPLAVNRFEAGRIEIPVTPLLRLQGYKDMAAVRDDVRRIATWAAARVSELAAPVAIFRQLPISRLGEDELELAGSRAFRSRQFGPGFAGCREAVAFILTLGPAVDEETLRLVGQDDVVEAVFIEYAGWIAIERATHALAAHLQRALKGRNLRLSRRLAPGYYDWSLEEQRDFVALFPAEALPIEILESCAILPKKSRTGLYGLQPASVSAHLPPEPAFETVADGRRAAL